MYMGTLERSREEMGERGLGEEDAVRSREAAAFAAATHPVAPRREDDSRGASLPLKPIGASAERAAAHPVAPCLIKRITLAQAGNQSHETHRCKTNASLFSRKCNQGNERERFWAGLARRMERPAAEALRSCANSVMWAQRD